VIATIPAPDMRISVSRMASSTLQIKSVLFIAMALRAPMTVVGPLTEVIRASFDLGVTKVGLLTTLPLLAFAMISPFAAALNRFGLEKSLFGAMMLISVGVFLRSAGSPWDLYIGTCVIGCGVAIGNVLLPSLMKREFPDHIAPLTVMYAVMMGFSAACASVIAVPLAQESCFGWPLALAITAALPLLAAIWLWKLNNWESSPNLQSNLGEGRGIRTSTVGWQVALFLGLNSFVYYVAIGWLPTILIEFRYSPEQAGSLHGLMQLAGILPAVFFIPARGRLHDHGKLAAAAALFSAIGFIGLLLLPNEAAFWVILFGSGTGAGMVLGMAFLGLRASSSHGVAVLSGMEQSVGYGLAAIGPPLIGALRETLASWTVPLFVCASVCVVTSILGILAGRLVTIGNESTKSSQQGERLQ
jgi:MFS transporter, CP family, cyanate transporter